ncbi:MAG: ATP-binding cassette domain-containing protein, partial [Oscillospiraceae bacterium]
MEKILSAKNIVKSYGNKEVLHSISIDIKPGKIYGLLGRNGAGKTTLLSCITAQNTIDSGEVTYDGEKVWENEKVLGEICFSREIPTTVLFGQNNFAIKDYLR